VNPIEDVRIEILGPQHDRSTFASGSEPLDRYFRTRAGQEARKNIAAPFVLVLADGSVGGYYTLSATAVKLADLPADVARRLPKYPLVPATLLGRLAVEGNIRARAMAVSCSRMRSVAPFAARSRPSPWW
jgi:hypothetical protein